MKNTADLEIRLLNELKQWFARQCQDNYADFYLYYLPTTAEHDGGILICKEDPPNDEYQLAWPEKIRKGCTIEQNFNWLRNAILYRLPVLSIN